ncbi:hypothetical protein [Paraliobacillus sp. JSM ZJ581]|uniref:hypothetical protein n=1 Tax=Paraliobacillus sp. JSM ZJ581 TaxID=3342118 RepID=UPI0035A8B03D
MSYDQNDIQYLLLQQKHYKKLIKSYQRNDISKEYAVLKQKNDKLTSEICDLHGKILTLNEKINNQKIESNNLIKKNQRLQYELEKERELNTMTETTDFLQSFIVDEISIHFLAIYHLYNRWISLDQQTDKEVHKVTESKLNHTENNINENNFLSTINKTTINKKISNSPSHPKPFHFKDLKSYKKAYLLPEMNKMSSHHNQALLQAKTKQIQKLKEKQSKQTESLDSSKPKAELDHLEIKNDDVIERAEKKETTNKSTVQINQTKAPKDKKSVFRRFLDKLMD